ncbi:hypothetical protein CYG68_20865 [Morganella morganii]|uniref:Uncharacterized protein n=1 Tax=Morganella morganii TaxID=582 RepID=A0A8I0Q6D9_MORMO|nr:hypothetical protein [Morganella morganii]
MITADIPVSSDISSVDCLLIKLSHNIIIHAVIICWCMIFMADLMINFFPVENETGKAVVSLSHFCKMVTQSGHDSYGIWLLRPNWVSRNIYWRQK